MPVKVRPHDIITFVSADEMRHSVAAAVIGLTAVRRVILEQKPKKTKKKVTSRMFKYPKIHWCDILYKKK